jgi:conjugal transfer pilus assembly protein TraE
LNLQEFLRTWRGTTLENRISRIVLVLLATAVLLLTMQVNRIERTVVLVPPALSGPVDLARNSASREAQEAWALYVAELLGNVTPSTGDFLMQTLEPLLANNLRRQVMEVIADQLEEIRRERVSMRFEPREVSYDEATRTVRVTGEHITEGPGAKPVRQLRTFELRVDYDNYRPLVTHLDAYNGEKKKESTDADR